MSIDINFYTFGKKINSTATPSTVNYATTCELRAGTDQLNPVILLDYPNPVAFNYAQIPAFSRYYFVKWTWQGGVWEGTLNVDPLASWKNTIRAYPQYVLRSASKNNDNLTDNTFPTSCVPQMSISTFNYQNSSVFSSYPSSGYHYVVKYLKGDGQGTSGGLVTTVLNESAFIDFSSGLTNLPDYSEIVNRCIMDVLYYPFDICLNGGFSVSGAYTYYFPGGTSINIDSGAGVIPDNKIYTEINWDITPSLYSEQSYKNMPPYYSAEILFYPYGTISLDIQKFMASPYDGVISLSSRINLENNSSILSYKFADKAGLPAYQILQNMPLGSKIPFALITSNDLRAGVNLLGNTISVVGSIASDNIKGAVDVLPDMLGNVLSGFIPSVDMAGSPDTMIYDLAPRLLEKRYDFTTCAEKYGLPLFGYVELSTLSGFCQCGNASLPLTCTETEHNEILNYMNGGFYLE